jgi:DNA-binding transcriptional MerR regulator
MAVGKAEGAFLTIGELSRELGIPQHVLRYWETRFPQLRPLQRSGNRRYYRPDDVELAGRINRLLNEEGYTIRGVQKLLEERTPDPSPPPPPDLLALTPTDDMREKLIAIRAGLLAALAADAA